MRSSKNNLKKILLNKKKAKPKIVKKAMIKINIYSNFLLKKYELNLITFNKRMENAKTIKQKNNFQLSIVTLQNKIRNLKEEMREINNGTNK